ncbi:MAG: hypothetical protein JSU87_15230 [Gemmatimonadota bacterium]|nr:MAG: hypothetical protein JSU87_15230 [Gemmatimonadota bacterium]
MPSDPRIELALRAVAAPIDRYRSAVVTTVEEVRGYLASHRSPTESGDGNTAARLGAFAAGRIDYARFATLLTEAPDDPERLRKVEKAFDILRVIAAGDEDLFKIKVKGGARLGAAVAKRLAEMGRGFAAARVAGMATAGSLNSGSAEELLAPMAFERWSAAERRLAPPLVVELEGADLHAGDLVEFMDGNVKILLLVNGESTPAPLAPLITPGTFVLQTGDDTGLGRFAEHEGPAVAALVPEDAARFIHDPARGANLWDRIEIYHAPEKEPRRSVGGRSVSQQKQELQQLLAMGKAPVEAAASVADAAPVTAVAPSGPVSNQVDKLAAWLLSQADLENIG